MHKNWKDALTSQEAEKADYANQANSGKLGYTTDACTPNAGREQTLIERLQFETQRADENNLRIHRAISILHQHPEFEDFLWLLRSGVI